MTEDEIYRSSTQYRLWSFTPEKLASLRASTHKLAAERVKAAFRRQGATEAAKSDVSEPTNGAKEDGDNNGNASDAPPIVDPLTLDEEIAIVEYYAKQARSIGEAEHFRLPDQVIATATQFMKRFYLSNSPMTYHPRQVVMTCLYVATKAEHKYIGLGNYVHGLGKLSKKPPTTDDILALEFLVTQGLRFTLDVRHPFRAIRGAYMELNAMIDGTAALLPGEGRSATEIQQELQKIAGKAGPKVMLDNAYSIAKSNILNSAALYTDAYFLYTPSQIMFAALLLADETLTTFYLDTKFSSSSPAVLELKNKVMATIRQCAAMLKAGPSSDSLTREDVIAIDRKLHKCMNPEAQDLVARHGAKKRDETTDGKLDESVAKRRKLEREKAKKEGEDLFGPSIGGKKEDAG